ncbi:GAP family protein [Mycobacteroides chelonae]
MWITLLVMALAVSFEPFRLGMTVLMLNRPRPQLQLLAFLCGGFVMGTTVGLVVLFTFRHVSTGSAQFTLPRVQIGIGLAALLVAALLASRVRGPSSNAQLDKVTGRIQSIATGGSLWVALVAGLGIALPSVDFLAALAVIVASGTPAATQVTALLMFNIIAFALIEVPLLAHVVAPERTAEVMARLNSWIQSNRRRNIALVLAVVGCVLLTVGLAAI